MGLIEILWTVAGVVVPLLLGTAWAMVGLTPPEFMVARGCVIVAALNWINAREAQTATPPQKIVVDYAYSLTLERLEPSLDLNNPENALEIRPRFKNNSGSPLKFKFENINIEVEGIHITPSVNEIILAKDQSVPIFFNHGFSLKQLDAFKDRTLGMAEWTISYGHPDNAPSRRATKRVRLDLFKTVKKGKVEVVGLNWTVLSERDEPIAR
jgi:hypothetical protein